MPLYFIFCPIMQAPRARPLYEEINDNDRPQPGASAPAQAAGMLTPEHYWPSNQCFL